LCVCVCVCVNMTYRASTSRTKLSSWRRNAGVIFPSRGHSSAVYCPPTSGLDQIVGVKESSSTQHVLNAILYLFMCSLDSQNADCKASSRKLREQKLHIPKQRQNNANFIL
jgi:hypothetical protein